MIQVMQGIPNMMHHSLIDGVYVDTKNRKN